eukprot:scaffold207621_cov22-Tisochrysis_lutea.AAC.2
MQLEYGSEAARHRFLPLHKCCTNASQLNADHRELMRAQKAKAVAIYGAQSIFSTANTNALARAGPHHCSVPCGLILYLKVQIMNQFQHQRFTGMLL